MLTCVEITTEVYGLTEHSIGQNVIPVKVICE